ncbi:MAG TPA: hypothetical protein VMF65_04630 [Acidimicrobiales bacterium]|nr:hypothetical protein [Acidimicrobiales bacterium]
MHREACPRGAQDSHATQAALSRQLNVAGLNTAGLNVAGPNVAGPNVAGLNVAGLNTAGLNTAGLNVAGLNATPRPRPPPASASRFFCPSLALSVRCFAELPILAPSAASCTRSTRRQRPSPRRVSGVDGHGQS